MATRQRDSFGTARTFDANGKAYRYYALDALAAAGVGDVRRLPYCLKVLLENLLRHEDGRAVTADHVRGLADWPAARRGGAEIAFHPNRVLMPDSSGVPLMADLAAMRDAMARLGGDPARVNPQVAIDFVIDHSVVVEEAGTATALARNVEIEFARNGERYAFLKWAEGAYDNVRLMPPGAGICHQINVEFLSRVVWTTDSDGGTVAHPDTLLGMDSHTPMVNGLGVLGWGVGGLEAGAAMLGQPVSMQVPNVIGCRLVGALPEGATTTDLVLTVTRALRDRGVVGAFVEFCGPALDSLPVPDRCTLANMSPEYGATMGFFPVDSETLAYLRTTGREEAQVALVEAYAKAQGLWRASGTAEPAFTDVVEIDLGAVTPTVAGPKRPQEKTPLTQAKAVARHTVEEMGGTLAGHRNNAPIGHGDVAVAALTSCTNTSNPSVMIAAGLLAQKAVQRGLEKKPWVKTSLAPGSPVVADYLVAAGLQPALDALGYNVVGFGCTTCMGNSGPLAPDVARAIDADSLVVGAVLSGNRNFEGRIHPQVRMNFLASPPLVVAYALAGSLDVDLTSEPIGQGKDGEDVYLRDLWPTRAEIEQVIRTVISPDMYRRRYAGVYEGGPEWQRLEARSGATFDWDPASDYIRRPPFFDDMAAQAAPVRDIRGARPLAILGDFITTDHISPVSAIQKGSLAGDYLESIGVAPRDFSSFAQRRVNHDVMLRGTFNHRNLRNEMAPGTEGGWTRHMPGGEPISIYEAAQRYQKAGVPLVVVGGKEYGQGSSRDWAAKGTAALGVRAVIAEGHERIHRSNLVGMGVLPLQFQDGATRLTLGLDGSETFDITGIEGEIRPAMDVPCTITRADGNRQQITLTCRLETDVEVAYYRDGGMLHYALRQML